MAEFFEIDPNHLDKEWTLHPIVYHDMALKLADARKAYERASAEEDVIEAEVSLAIRRDPNKYDLPKATEDTVKQAVKLDQKYQRARMKAIGAKHDLDVLQAAVTTLEHKKYALQDLVKLRLADYFSEPRTTDVGTRDHMLENERERVFGKKKRGTM